MSAGNVDYLEGRVTVRVTGRGGGSPLIGDSSYRWLVSSAKGR